MRAGKLTLMPVRRKNARARHERRPRRSNLAGPYLGDPTGERAQFDAEARAVTQHLRRVLPGRLDGVEIGYITMPEPQMSGEVKLYFTVDRENRRILMHRALIQRAKVLHVNDSEHRRLFIDHCVYRAVCEYLDEDPRDLIPGVFEHF